jgi:hypothetical protein
VREAASGEARHQLDSTEPEVGRWPACGGGSKSTVVRLLGHVALVEEVGV